MLPPRLVRRLVLAPIVVVVALGVVVLSPLLGLLALLFGLAGLARAGRMRNLRLLSFAVVWLTAEIVTLFVLLGLWVISGFGGRMHTEPYQSRHYAVVRRFLERLCRGAERAYGLRLEVEEPELSGEERVARAARPVIVLCRHSGPGDSLLLVQQLLSVYGRRPRVVMKATLQFDPLVDVFGNRLPNVFIQHRDGGEGMLTEQIERLARGLDRSGALVIFPEGGHWTPGRWRRGVRRLEAAGRKDLADRARAMPNLLPPRPGGTVAAIRACPDADVIFVAHAGLDTILSIGDVWRRFPINQVIRARWWRVRFDEVPRDAAHEEQVQWLFGWWERLDRWIAENRPVGAAAPAVKPEVHSDTALHCARVGSPLRLPGLDGHRRSGARVVLITGPAVVVVLEVDVGIGLVGGAVVVTGGVVSDTVVVSAAVVLVVRAGVVVVVVVVVRWCSWCLWCSCW
jgi:1-acyl-sn-glycerol-3-phosphate acyltransferase